MVDILEVSGANRPKAPLAVTPTSTQSEAQIAAPGVELGQALRGAGRAVEALSDQLDAASVPEAQAAGLAAVGRDDNGLPTFEPRVFALSKADQAYNAAGRQGARSGFEMNSQRGLQEIAQQFPNDPAGFQAASKAFIKEQGAGSGELRPLIQAEAEKVAQQHLLSISNRKFTLDTDNARVAIVTQIEDNQNQLFALARRGGMGTPEVAEALAKNRTLYEELGKNPAYGYPEARVKSEVERVQSQAIGEGIVGEVDRLYSRNGKAAAQKYLTDEILNNPKLNLPNSTRSTLYSNGLARLQYHDGETKAQVAAHRSTVSTIITGLENKLQIPEGQIDDAIGTAQKLGDAESVSKLLAARSNAALTRSAAGLTDAEKVQHFAATGGLPATAPAGIDVIINNAAAKHGVSPRFMAKVAFIESRFDPNAINGGSKATGLFQFIPSTWKQYGPGQDPRDPAANADAAARLTVANRNQLRASIGREPTEGELYLAHQQGAGGAAALLKDPSARAVDVVGQAAVTGNGGTLEMTAGQFATLWTRKFDGASAQVPAAAAVSGKSPFTQQQLASNPFLNSVWIESQLRDQKEVIASASRMADAISSGIDKGMLPRSEDLGAFLQMADQFPDQLGRAREQLLAKAQGHDDAQGALGQPTDAGSQLVRDALVKAQGAPIVVQQRAEAMQKAYERGEKNLKEQPWEEAARRGWSHGPLPALDTTTPAGMQAGLAARSQVATSITARTGTAQAPLSRQDMGAVVGVWTNGVPGQRQLVAGHLASLPPEQFGLVMADKQMRDSLIGMSRSGDPEKMSVAFSLMDAEQRRDPDGFHQRYGKDVENRMAAWTVRMSHMSAADLAKEAARYNDPATHKAREQLREEGLTKVKTTTAGSIAGLFGWNPLPWTGPSAPAQPGMANRLENEFRQEFAATYSEIGDEGKARELTVQRLGRVWGVSAINNGALMRFPPEKAYPTIDGSHDWITKQFDDDVRVSLGRPAPAPDGRRERASARLAMTDSQRAEAERVDALLAAPRMLVADPRTEAEISSGLPASYAVILKAPNGMFTELRDANDRVLRFRPDLETSLAPKRAATQAEVDRTRANDAVLSRLEADAARKRDARNARRAEAGQ